MSKVRFMAAKQVLILEDNEDWQAIITELLKSVDEIQCFVASDFREAVRLTRHRPFDLFVVDPGLPSDNEGVQFLNILADQGKHVPTVLVSVQDQAEVEAPIYYRIEHFFKKSSMDPHDFRQRIETILKEERLMSASILVVFANPKGSDPLRLQEENRIINECMKLSKHRDKLSLTICPAARIDDVRRALLEQEYHIVQFSGHASQKGLAFEDESGTPQIVPQGALAKFMARHSPPVRCVILNACYTIDQGELVSMGVPFTIAMDGPISDSAAKEFTRGFYDAIGAGKDIRFAYDEGCNTMALKGFFSEEMTPKLLEREPGTSERVL